jgi:hypothetical protein
MHSAYVLASGKLMVADTVSDVPPLDAESIKLTPSTHSFTISLCVTLIVWAPAAVG